MQDLNVKFPGGFAVLMALYCRDNPSLFEASVDSVLKNDLLPNQFLIVVDGPLTGDLELVIKKLLLRYEGSIRLLRLPVNRGLAHALNIGLTQINYPWVVRADSDDINRSDRFSKLAHLLACYPSAMLLGSAIQEIDQFGRVNGIRYVPESDAEIRKFIKKRNPFNHMSVAYYRDAVISVGGYPNIHLKEDYALWCRLLANNILAVNTREILVNATAGKDMYKRRGGLKYAMAEWSMQCELVRSGMKSVNSAIIDGLLRAFIFLLPALIRGWIYENHLREYK